MGYIFSGDNQNMAQPTGICERDGPVPSSHNEEGKAQRKTDLVSSHNCYRIFSGAHLSQARVRGKRIRLHMEEKSNQPLLETLYIPSTVLSLIHT